MSHLTSEQRYTIGVLLEQNFKKSEIAILICKDKSVITRELKRNCDLRSGKYNYQLAQRKYENRQKVKPKKIMFTFEIKQTIHNFLLLGLSPEQIVGKCFKTGLDCVSIERIYQYIWKDKKDKGNLYLSLRTTGKRYRKRGNKKDSRGIIANRKSIEDRPKIVELKERFGDLEIDTIIGKNHKGAIVTINDRATGILRMKKIKSKESELVKQATIELLHNWKPFLNTITSDNGKEFAQHQEISSVLEIDFYFANPYSPWERGANENLNGLIRQYIPKSSSFDELTDEEIIEIQEKLNNRPRKRFNFETPNYMFNQKVAFVT
jgi:transposase, IS30 family